MRLGATASPMILLNLLNVLMRFGAILLSGITNEAEVKFVEANFQILLN
jgi:hypothetical protein